MSKDSTNTLPTLGKANYIPSKQDGSNPKKIIVVKGKGKDQEIFEQLLNERQEYLKLAHHLMGEIDAIMSSNQKLESEIRVSERRLSDLHMNVLKYSKSVDFAEKSKNSAIKRMKLYEDQISKQTDGTFTVDIESKIQNVRDDLLKLQKEISLYDKRRHEEQEIVDLIKEYDATSKDLIQMNKKLTDEVWRLFRQLKSNHVKLPPSVFPIIEFFRLKMEESERLRKQLAIFNPQDAQNAEITSDAIVLLDERLKQCLPLFNDLERIMTAPSRPGSQMSQMSSSWMNSGDEDGLLEADPGAFIIRTNNGIEEPNERRTQNPRVSASVKKLRDSYSNSRKENGSMSSIGTH